jgi:hypothetical protein
MKSAMRCGASELPIMRFIVVTNDNLHDDVFLEKKIFRNTRSMIASASFNKSPFYGERVGKFCFHALCFHEIGSEAR